MALRTGSSLTLSGEEWQTTFLNIGISENFSSQYAATFHEQEVQKALLKHVSDEELRDVFSIKLIGHRLAIRHSVNQLSLAPDEPSSGGNVPIVKPQVRHTPPQLQPKMTPSSFRAFLSHWKVYKQLVGLPNNTTDGAAHIFSLTCTDHPEIRQTGRS